MIVPDTRSKWISLNCSPPLVVDEALVLIFPALSSTVVLNGKTAVAFIMAVVSTEGGAVALNVISDSISLNCLVDTMLATTLWSASYLARDTV